MRHDKIHNARLKMSSSAACKCLRHELISTYTQTVWTKFRMQFATETLKTADDTQHTTSSRRVNSYSSNNDKHHTRIMCGLTPYIACLSPISMSRAVSCLLSCRHSTAALRDSITILAWFCSNSSFKKTSPETSLVISFVNNFFKW